MLTSGIFNGEYIGQDEQGAIYDRSYNADFYSRYFSSFISNGVLNENDLQVIPAGGRDITVTVGTCFINGYYAYNNENITLSIEENTTNNPRVDRVILRLDLSKREITIKLLKGTPNTEPPPPEITRSGDIYDLSLAVIRTESYFTTITKTNITDNRQDNSLCGIVTNKLGEIDKEELFNKLNEDLEGIKQLEKDNFYKWFDSIKKIMDSNKVSKHIIQTFFDTFGVHDFKYNITNKTFEKYNKENGELVELGSLKGAGVTISKTNNIKLIEYQNKITLNWADAENFTNIEGEILKQWKGTILVKKEGSPPTSYEDGEILLNNTERDKYLNVPFIDEDLEPNKIYYYGLFPYDNEEVYNMDTSNIIKAQLNLETLENVIYSFIIDTNESDPYKNITYGDEATKYTTPESWDKSILFQSIKPCIVKDGIVQYYLNPFNYEIKENGEPSKLDGTDGEVMVEFPSIFYKMEQVENGKYKLTIVCNYDKYINDTTFTREHLNYKYKEYGKKIYHSAYLCTLKNDELLSIVSEKYTTDTPSNNVVRIRKKNNTSFIASIYTFNLLTILTILRFKTTYLADVFNLDTYENLVKINMYLEKHKFGSLTKGGLFSGCGNKKSQQAVKVCGIEFECAGYTKDSKFNIRTYMTCVEMRNFRNYYERYETIFYTIPQFQGNSYVGGYIYSDQRDIIFKSDTDNYTTMGNYFNDFIINSNIGFFPYRRDYKPNSTNNTYLTFSGRRIGGDYSSLLYNLFPKNDDGSNIRPSDGKTPKDGYYSTHYIYIPPNQ